MLEIRGVTVRYGGSVAIDDVTFDVDRNTCTGLIGPNGAGKTSLIDAITGFTRSSGSVSFEGRQLQALRAHARARLGVQRSFQGAELFDDLSVLDNILLGHCPPFRESLQGLLLGRPQRVPEHLRTLIADLGLEDLTATPAQELTHGQRKVVGLARSLAGRPTLVLLDEPAAGLDRRESAQLGALLRRVVDDGTTLLLVDHDMTLIMDICDHVHVLDGGRLIASGTPAEVSADQLVIDAYLGAPDAVHAEVAE
ncbi:ABC transporter ATP-binding protein [Nocardioides sp.]|uniref:ABC transporter ATP-binding protein n=1 Tax=Nocardioides sp. TaxID=35761 RepID=UPI0039E3CE70